MEHSSTGFSPAVNIIEKEKEYEIELAVPGFEKKDFNLEIDGDVLSISAEIKNENKEDKDSYYRKEFSFKSFKRSFSLPKPPKRICVEG